ncbi:MAG: 30S ribosomal protein S4 [Patescibacteria group bacterium]|nr:30S ribosomal protein S4 [Patescibacteria group bacterium]MDE1943873.1 30S ribosomal protein S4 [Patescibacteria group bacterium]MDE1944951.1 30S ribosomal protein S4 [Patescibacteria group bacterium]MDE2057551.1 30S ribosomal protein S4 [Patescibacteria group bacterium]
MKTGPRYKLAKRLGATVFEKAQTQKFALSADRAARNKRRSRSRQSEYGRQMLEKQKVRVTYGLPERQFRRYVDQALAAHDAKPVEHLHQELELRLDNVAWRLGLAATRRAARQMAAHGHLTVNGRKVRIPSYALGVGDVVGVREGSKRHGSLIGFGERAAESRTPSWLALDAKKLEGSVIAKPSTETADPAGDLGAVLSFYTR